MMGVMLGKSWIVHDLTYWIIIIYNSSLTIILITITYELEDTRIFPLSIYLFMDTES